MYGGNLSTAKKVFKSTSIILVGDLSFKLISLILVIYLAKYLEVESFGKYNFVLAYISIFGIITDLGLNSILVREMARNIEAVPKIIGNAYVIKLILAFFAIFLSLLVAFLMHYSSDTTLYLYIASFMLIFQSFSDTYRTVFQAKLKMEYEIISKLIFKIVSVAVILYLISIHSNLFQLICAFTFLESLKMLLSYAFLRKIVEAKFDIDLVLWRTLLTESLPVTLTSIFFLINQRIDVLMLSNIKSDFEIGLYSAAYRLSEPLGIIPYALIASLFPIMSHSFQKSKDKLFKSNEMGFKFIIMTMLPICVGTTLIADKIILLIYDQSYRGSITALQILIWALFFASINYHLTSVLLATNRQRMTCFSMAISVIVNVLLNLILIPNFSYNGASIATVISELTQMTLNFYFVSEKLSIPPLGKILIKPLASCLIMGTFVYSLNNLINVNVFFVILVAVAIYPIMLFGLKTFSKDEISLIRKIFNI